MIKKLNIYSYLVRGLEFQSQSRSNNKIINRIYFPAPFEVWLTSGGWHFLVVLPSIIIHRLRVAPSFVFYSFFSIG